MTILAVDEAMSKNKDNIPEKIKTELGGMRHYEPTSNTEVAGYMTYGDVENAGDLI